MYHQITIHTGGDFTQLSSTDRVTDSEEIEHVAGAEALTEAIADRLLFVYPRFSATEDPPPVNRSATALAAAFGHREASFRGDVLVLAGLDRRGRHLGLTQEQRSALIEPLEKLRHREQSGGHPVLHPDELEFTGVFRDENPPDHQAAGAGEKKKHSTTAMVAAAAVTGLLAAGAGLGAGYLAFDDDGADQQELASLEGELDEREDDLDEREAELDAEESGLETRAEEVSDNEERSAELDQREESVAESEENASDLDEREEAVSEAESSLDTRESDVSDREETVETRESAADQRESDLDDREDDLDEREAELENQETDDTTNDDESG